MKKTKEKEKKKPSSSRDVFSDLYNHYTDAQSELETRITHKERGFDVYDKMYRNYIEPSKWPFKARIPDGRASTILNRKAERLIASKLKGKLIPRRSGSELGAKIGTELLLWEWTENDIRGDQPMLQKWRRMDIATRKYGAAFGLCSWDKKNDIPTFEVLENRNVLTQPGAKSIDGSDWVQVRRFVFLSELEKINKMSVVGPLYDEDAISFIKNKKLSNTHYRSVNRDVLGLSDGCDEKIEIVTEYRHDEFFTFCLLERNRKGVVPLRRFKNPYIHGEIPIVRLVYDPIDDDIYGRPELENVAPLIKACWAILSQSMEQLQNELYTILMVNPKRVSVDTLQFGPGRRWFMENPGADVVPFQTSTVGLTKMKEHFGLFSSLIMEGVGETGQDVSNVLSAITEKTATEIKDLAMLRSARDNANKLMLSSALSKMVHFWFTMSQQFIDGYKLVRIQGKDALRYLIEEGMNGWTLTPEGFEAVSLAAQEMKIPFDDAYAILREQGELEKYAVPLYPIESPDLPQKLVLEDGGRAGFLAVTPNDILGEYDFIPDIEAMSLPNDQSIFSSRSMMVSLLERIEPKILEQGYRVRWKEIVEKIAESAKLPDADMFFEAIPEDERQKTTLPSLPQNEQAPLSSSNSLS